MQANTCFHQLEKEKYTNATPLLSLATINSVAAAVARGTWNSLGHNSLRLSTALLKLLGDFPIADVLLKELVHVQAALLHLVRDAEMKTRDVLQDKKQGQGNHKRVRGDGSNLGELSANLDTDTINAARGDGSAIKGGDGLRSKDTGKERSGHTSDAMELEDIHSLVDVQPLVDVVTEGANDGGEETDDSGQPRANVTGSRSNTHKSSDDTLTGTNNTEATLVLDVVDEHPADGTSRGSRIGVESGQHGTDAAVQRRTAVEAEPSEVDENGAQEDKSNVVRLSVGLVTLGLLALSQCEGIGKGSPTRRDVDGTTTSEVKRRELREINTGL